MQSYEAEDLLATQIEHWVSKGKTADQMFKDVYLHLEQHSLFSGLNFNFWSNFVMAKCKQNVDESLRMMFRTLSTKYDDEGFTSALADAIATGSKNYQWLQILQLLRIIKGKLVGEAEEITRNLLQLEKVNGVEDLYDQYVGKVFTQPDEKIFEACQFQLGDSYLAEMLFDIAANKPEETLAKRLQDIQFKQWSKNRKLWPKLKLKLANEGVDEAQVSKIEERFLEYQRDQPQEP